MSGEITFYGGAFAASGTSWKFGEQETKLAEVKDPAIDTDREDRVFTELGTVPMDHRTTLDVIARRPIFKLELNGLEYELHNSHDSGRIMSEGFKTLLIAKGTFENQNDITSVIVAASNCMQWRVAIKTEEVAGKYFVRIHLQTLVLPAFPEVSALPKFYLSERSLQVWKQCPSDVRMFLTGDFSTGECHLWPGKVEAFQSVEVDGKQEPAFTDVGIHPGHAQLRERHNIILERVWGATMRGASLRITKEGDKNSEYNIRNGNFSRAAPDHVIKWVNHDIEAQLTDFVDSLVQRIQV